MLKPLVNESLQLATHELVNGLGDRVRLLNFGARITALELQLDSGPRNVMLGYASPVDYLEDRFFTGATTGRFSNRIGGARFSLAGTDHRLAPNEGAHHLHGGLVGFDKRFWTRDEQSTGASVTYQLTSAHGDQGYPGNLQATVAYSWNDQRELTVELGAECDRPTHVNLGNHAYFNLDGGRGDIRRHRLSVDASTVLAVDKDLIPTGDRVAVEEFGIDLRKPRRIADILSAEHAFIQKHGGLDLHFPLDGRAPAARLWSGEQDLLLDVSTTSPGLQVYTGQALGHPWAPFAGLCLEAHYFPDAPHHPGFPDTLLEPGERYRERITYRFEAGGRM